MGGTRDEKGAEERLDMRNGGGGGGDARHEGVGAGETRYETERGEKKRDSI